METERTCTKCATTKPVEDFVKSADWRRCKACKAKYEVERKGLNRRGDRQSAKEKRAYREEMWRLGKSMCRKCHCWLAKDDFTAGSGRKSGCSSYCKKCTVVVRREDCTQAKYRRRHRLSAMYWGAKSRAKQKDLAFTISLEYVRSLYDGKCALTGLEFNLEGNVKQHPRTLSMDRIDSSKGYEPGNVRLICYALNVSFGHWGMEETLPIMRELLIRQGN